MIDPVFNEIKDLLTEQRNPVSKDIDIMSIEDALRVINSEDQKVAKAVEKEIPHIAKVVEIYVDTIKRGGRIFYIGAGTSGRLGVLDAAELPPTYGTPFWLVQGLIAGGYGAVFRAQEGAEDDPKNAIGDLKERGLTANDFVIGIAASKRTPYVVAGLKYAREVGAKTAMITVIPREQVDLDVDVKICPVVGPEVVMGSTRMKAGTAQKLVLNMISTVAMIRLGKVYQNMMVDLWATSKKLVERSKRVIMIATGVDYDTAAHYLDLAGGSVKIAIVMILSGADYEEAKKKLEEADGFVRFAIENIKGKVAIDNAQTVKEDT